MYKYYSDGVSTVREGIRNGSYVVDKALTPTAFAGSYGTDWVTVFSIT